MLAGTKGPRRDVVLLNAAAALLVADVVDSLQDGVVLAARAIDSGDALVTLARLIEVSNNASAANIAASGNEVPKARPGKAA